MAPGSDDEPLRIAYLTTAYPEVSHTFIRREIVELERRGHAVLRLAIRKGIAVDPSDVAELEKSVHVLEKNPAALVGSMARVALERPGRFARAVASALKMHRKSDRGLVRHAAYLVEACELLGQLKARDIEHLHVHFGTNAAAVARLIRLLGGPSYSMTIHGPDEFDATVAFSLGKKIEDSAFTVAITSYCSAQLRRWVSHEHWDKIKIVHCTVGDHLLAEPEPIAQTSRTFVNVGRLSAQKGQILLIDAMARLRDDGIEAKLVLCGDGEMREVIEAKIRDSGLQDHVEVAGWVDASQIQEHLRNARALVLPSFAEGLPVVIMEAFAAARPVVTTQITGIPELVEQGANGWLTIAGDVDGLVKAMREVLETPAPRLDAMGREGRARVLEHHRTATEVAKLEKWFRKYRGTNRA